MRREDLIRILRKNGYRYKRETENTMLYRRGTHHVYVPKNAVIPPDVVRSMLRRLGYAEDDIDVLLDNERN